MLAVQLTVKKKKEILILRLTLEVCFPHAATSLSSFRHINTANYLLLSLYMRFFPRWTHKVKKMATKRK